MKMDGYSSDGTTPVHLDNKTTDFFPSVNVAYNLSQKHLVRAAYGRSVNRPEFREVVPYVYFNFERDANIVGNTELKNAYADNIDLRYEFYPAAGEMITIGGFYKHFKDPIEETYNEAGSGLQYTYHNAKNAETFGVELDVKKNLDFIGLRGLSFVCNAAYIYSRVRFEEGAPERDRPLAGQSPYLVNAGFSTSTMTRGFPPPCSITGSGSVLSRSVSRCRTRTRISLIYMRCPATRWILLSRRRLARLSRSRRESRIY